MEDKKMDRLKHLISLVNCNPSFLENVKNDPKFTKHFKDYKKCIEINQIISELKIDKETLLNIWVDVRCEKSKRSSEYRKKPKLERKDNKDYINYGRSPHSNSSGYSWVRYPSKKRSLRTWRNFYKLFPFLAERDNFDGKTSDKMK